jgi:hypothetical protein
VKCQLQPVASIATLPCLDNQPSVLPCLMLLEIVLQKQLLLHEWLLDEVCIQLV